MLTLTDTQLCVLCCVQRCVHIRRAKIAVSTRTCPEGRRGFPRYEMRGVRAGGERCAETKGKEGRRWDGRTRPVSGNVWRLSRQAGCGCGSGEGTGVAGRSSGAGQTVSLLLAELAGQVREPGSAGQTAIPGGLCSRMSESEGRARRLRRSVLLVARNADRCECRTVTQRAAVPSSRLRARRSAGSACALKTDRRRSGRMPAGASCLSASP